VGRAVAAPRPPMTPGWMEDGKGIDHSVQNTKLLRCHPSCGSFCTQMPVTSKKMVEKRKEQLQREPGGLAAAGGVSG